MIPAGLTPCTTPNSPGATAGYVDCNRTNLVTLGNTGFSNYNSLQSRLSIEHWRGVTAGISYTWSKDIDNVSEIYATGTGGNTTNFSQSPFDLSQAERGVSGLDYPQLASIYMIYEVPRLLKQDSPGGKLLNGWQINPVWRYASGQPYTVTENAAADTVLCDPTRIPVARPAGPSSIIATRQLMQSVSAPIPLPAIAESSTTIPGRLRVFRPFTGFATMMSLPNTSALPSPAEGATSNAAKPSTP